MIFMLRRTGDEEFKRLYNRKIKGCRNRYM